MSKDKLYDKLIQIESKYEDLTQQLSSPEVLGIRRVTRSLRKRMRSFLPSSPNIANGKKSRRDSPA